MSTQGLVWWNAQVTIKSDPVSPYTYVVLEGVVGDGDKGDIVVDDMDIKTGACSKSLPGDFLIQSTHIF